jgi:hypothetical protein
MFPFLKISKSGTIYMGKVKNPRTSHDGQTVIGGGLPAAVYTYINTPARNMRASDLAGAARRAFGTASRSHGPLPGVGGRGPNWPWRAVGRADARTKIRGDLKASAGVWEGRSDEFGESRSQHASGLAIDLNSPGSPKHSHVTLATPTRGPERATIEAETMTWVEKLNESKTVGIKSRARVSGRLGAHTEIRRKARTGNEMRLGPRLSESAGRNEYTERQPDILEAFARAIADG